MMSWVGPTAKREHFSSAKRRNKDINTNSILSSCPFMESALALCLVFRLVAMRERGRGGGGDGRRSLARPRNVGLTLAALNVDPERCFSIPRS